MRAQALAKVNLFLRVRSAGPDGLHPLLSLVQSVTWADLLEMERAGEDSLDAFGAPVPLDDANLVWKAVEALRSRSEFRPPVRVGLDKQIPVAAGLGGGSADAAAALVLYGQLADMPTEELESVAPQVGADVPFCLGGGLAMVEGYGEVVTPLPGPAEPYHLAVVVPPVELSTAEVYAAWDRLGEPRGPEMRGRDLPPPLRQHQPLRNDLYPAAAALSADLDGWRAELEAAWSRPVLMSGSGPALFSFFPAEDEARHALEAVPPGARARRAVRPASRGVVMG